MIRIIKAQKGSFFAVSGSLSLLEKQLHSEEMPLIVVQGHFDDKPGVLTATDERVIFAGKLFFNTIVKDFPYSKLSSVSLDSGIMNATVKFEFSGGKLEVEKIQKSVAREFVDIVQQKINGKDASVAPVTPAAAEVDVFDKLRKLGELKAAGILTEDEFQEQKKKLLSA